MYAKYCQFRPLRVLLPRDSAAVEQQPERAIFSDDLKSSLFRADIDTTSSLCDGSMRQELKQRLVIRCLQGFGVVLPYCECSHSTVPRSVQVLLDSANTVNAEEDVLFHGILSGKGGGSVQASIESSLDSIPDPAARTDGIVSKLLRAGWGGGDICMLQSALVRKHLVCNRFGFDSELSFIIRLVTNIVRRTCASVRDAAQGTVRQVGMLSAEFLSQLRRLLVRLVTVRHMCDVSLLSDLAAQSGSTATSVKATSSVLTVHQAELVEAWRSACRNIIESTVVSSDSAAAAPAAADTGPGTVRIPSVGDLSLWAEYLSAECMLGNQPEALKVRNNSYDFAASFC